MREPTGRERPFPDGGVIVGKTDPCGIITYANPLFCEISGYAPHELIGQPDDVDRHPRMPSCVLARMRRALRESEEVFVALLHLCRNGDHYWTLAHITPTVGPDGKIVGYHSTRRSLPARAKERLEALYRELRAIEDRHADPGAGTKAAEARLEAELAGFRGDLSRFTLELAL